jgi:hypothetical protein
VTTAVALRPVGGPPVPRQRALGLAAVLVPGSLLAGVAAGWLASGPVPVLALLLPAALVPVLLWRTPTAGVLVLFATSVTVEQFAYTVGNKPGALTSRIPFFHTVTAGSGVTPMELLLALAVVIWAMRTVQRHERLFHPSGLATSLALLGVLLVVFLVVGLSRHGNLKAALWEVKPFLYVMVFYVLAASLLSTKEAVRGLLWIIVVGSGVKAAYGLVMFMSVRHAIPRPDAVLGHEESFFFGLFVIATLGMWTFGVTGRLRRVATTFLPVVLMADMVNSRRTAWAILFATALTMIVISYARFPSRRRVLLRCMGTAAVGLAVYLPLFWNHTGATAQPARAVRSVVAPSSSDARDSSSDKYRMEEDANLVVNIRAHHGTGGGFGVPINYAVPITDLTGIASMLAFVPHNGVYWVWMRMGVLGEAVFLLFVGQGVVAASKLVRVGDPETALLGAIGVCALLAYLIMGEKDLGFWWLRMAVFIGVLLGTVDARRRALEAAA